MTRFRDEFWARFCHIPLKSAVQLWTTFARFGPLLSTLWTCSGPPLSAFWTTLYYPGLPCTTLATLYYLVLHHPRYTLYTVISVTVSSMPAPVCRGGKKSVLGSEVLLSLGRSLWEEESGQNRHRSSGGIVREGAGRRSKNVERLEGHRVFWLLFTLGRE